MAQVPTKDDPYGLRENPYSVALARNAVLKDPEEVIRNLINDTEIAEARLLNAFQLVKNGKQYSGLKFNEFKNLLDNKFDHNGNKVKR